MKPGDIYYYIDRFDVYYRPRFFRVDEIRGERVILTRLSACVTQYTSPADLLEKTRDGYCAPGEPKTYYLGYQSRFRVRDGHPVIRWNGTHTDIDLLPYDGPKKFHWPSNFVL